MSNAIRIHRFPLSGHSHRVELFARLAGIDYEPVDVDLAGGEHRKEPFLSLNPFGQVPVIEDGDTVVQDSNAILVYLARRYAPDWLPSDPALEAQVQRFLSVAAGPVAYGPAAARLITVFGADLDPAYTGSVARGILEKLDTHLQGKQWLVGDRPTIADIANHSYIAHAPEGNVSLEPYGQVRAWLARVEGLPGFVPMPATPAGLAA